jgi:hypothetical protein
MVHYSRKGASGPAGSVEKLGMLAGSPAYRPVSATIRALTVAALPGAGDYETAFSPGRALVRRGSGRISGSWRVGEATQKENGEHSK